jgi:hypothetical protein
MLQSPQPSAQDKDHPEQKKKHLLRQEVITIWWTSQYNSVLWDVSISRWPELESQSSTNWDKVSHYKCIHHAIPIQYD